MPCCSNDWTWRGAAAGGGAADGWPAGAAAGALDRLGWTCPGCAPSTSALTIRPCGPEPFRLARSKPFCSAMRRASGDAKMRPPRSSPACEGGGGAADGGGAVGAELWACAPSVTFGDTSPEVFASGEELVAFGAGVAEELDASSPDSLAMGALTLTPS